jgi:hypothetical protein
LPSLFATETTLFGWQGLSATLPATWNLASFGGKDEKGELRIDDEEGARLELRWETPKGDVDIERSIDNFLKNLGKTAEKRGLEFEIVNGVRLVSKSSKRKAQLVNFGWKGDRDEPVSQGWGVGWKCDDCGRVVVAHMMGRGNESADKVQRLAGEVLTTLECHGTGGWRIWSVFDCRVEIPEEFHLGRAKLMTGQIDMEWIRPRKPGMFAVFGRDERIALSRWSLAAVLLERDTLTEWAKRKLTHRDKRWVFKEYNDDEGPRHAGLLSIGALRDLRLRYRGMAIDYVLRRRSPRAELRVWQCEPSNKIFALSTDLSAANQHVRADVLDSLECHS